MPQASPAQHGSMKYVATLPDLHDSPPHISVLETVLMPGNKPPPSPPLPVPPDVLAPEPSPPAPLPAAPGSSLESSESPQATGSANANKHPTVKTFAKENGFIVPPEYTKRFRGGESEAAA
jgi:hypothetical protein